MKRNLLLVLLLIVFAIMLAGCAQQLGETRAEVHRRHIRTIQMNSQQMLDDIDRALLLDKPSRLTDKRIQ